MVCVYDPSSLTNPWAYGQYVTVLSLVSPWAVPDLECRRALGAGPCCWFITGNAVKPHQSPTCAFQNRGVYMFRIDNDHVIDATLTGGPARWVALEGSLTSSWGIPHLGLGLLEALNLWGLFPELVHSNCPTVSLPSALLIFQLCFMAAMKKGNFFDPRFFLTLDFFDMFLYLEKVQSNVITSEKVVSPWS